MPALSEIEERLRKLPFLRRAADLAALLSEHNKKVEPAAESLPAVSQKAKYARRVFPTINVDETARLLRLVEKGADELKAAVVKDVFNLLLQRRECDALAGSIERLSQNASAQLEQAWEVKREAHIAPHRNRTAVLERLKLAVAGRLRACVGRLEHALAAPPGDEKQVKVITDLQNELQEIIDQADLAGDVGDFLSQALNSGAPVSHLEKKAVKGFLDKHKLWDKFTVRL